MEDFKKCWKFSAIRLDQTHEQNNKLIKDSGAAVGLTDKPCPLKCWMVSGPEQMRLLKEFQKNDHRENTDVSHEQGLATQEAFKNQVNSLCQTIISMRNPFLDDSGELMKLDTHDCVDQKVVTALDTMERTAIIQYSGYVRSVLVERTIIIQSPIKKNRNPLYKRHPQKKS